MQQEFEHLPSGIVVLRSFDVAGRWRRGGIRTVGSSPRALRLGKAQITTALRLFPRNRSAASVAPSPAHDQGCASVPVATSPAGRGGECVGPERSAGGVAMSPRIM